MFVTVDSDVDGTLNKQEFREVYEVLKKRSAGNALAAMGLTTGKLVTVIGGLTV